nr:MAG TPA: hypothetical protein [Caudoviricetes sp.]
MIYWHGNNTVIHLVLATHTTYQHTPYTCVYTPIYPVFLHGLLGRPSVITELI